MSIMYCEHCDRYVDTDYMDHCEWGTDEKWDHFKCEDCVDLEIDDERMVARTG